MIGPTWIVLFAGAWYLFPGVNLPVSMALISVMFLGQGLYYAFIAGIMPRTGGGTYIPLSRVINPYVGMGMLFLFLAQDILTAGFVANILITVGAAGPIAVYGTVTGNTALQNLGILLTTPTYAFGVGTIVLLFVASVMVAGTKAMKVINKIAFVIGTIGFLLIIWILATTTQAQFQTAYNTFAGSGAYQNMINTAHSNGWSIPSNWITPTILSLPFSFFAIYGCNTNCYYAGEIKQVGKTMVYSVALSLLFVGAIYSIIAFLLGNSFGVDFITSAGYLSNAVPNKYPLPSSLGPWPNTFVAIVNANPIVNALIIVSFLAWGYLIMMAFFLLASRNILALSFDRAIPAVLGSVSDRFHTPIVSIVVTTVLAWIALGVYSFLPTVLGVVNVTFLAICAVLLDGLAGAVLPWKMKNVFMQAPGFLKKTIAGVPIVSILGVYDFLFMASLLVESFLNPAVAGTFGMATAGSIPVIFIIGVVILYASKRYHAREGLDISMVFKEIPPE